MNPEKPASPDVAQIKQQLAQLGDESTADWLGRYFKAEAGGYGANDRFRGIRVPVLRRLVREHKNLALEAIIALLQSEFHEDRVLACLFLVRDYTRGNAALRAQIYELYLSLTRFINNWDLVDTSAPFIVGAHLWERDRAPLFHLANSANLWERRISIMATFDFIKRGDFSTTLALSAHLLHDREDLIHKATGWMLREVGKRNLEAESPFLETHYRQMPRTMLRYAIEKFPEERRQQFLRGEV